jgi:hypothetical protein
MFESMNPTKKTGLAILGGLGAGALLFLAARRVRQFICGLHGHDALLHFESNRLSLECTSCGYDSPGWDVGTKPVPAAAPEVKPQPIRMSLVGQRRVA